MEDSVFEIISNELREFLSKNIVGTQQYPYPNGIWAPTKPSDKEIHITWDTNGSPKFIHQWDDQSGNWLDITNKHPTIMHTPAQSGICAPGLTFPTDEPTKWIEPKWGPECECPTKNPPGQGHSYWCPVYKREF